MSNILKRWRKESLNNIKKYMLYALGEILLIIIGILLAVNINERQINHKNNILRCQYLQELNVAIGHDIEDVEENIDSYNRRNPKMKEILTAIEDKKLAKVDSLNEKINTINKYAFFVQQSKSKIDELKYARVNLIVNRKLKEKVLQYEENNVYFLKYQEERYENSVDDVRKYFGSRFKFYTSEMENDAKFYSMLTLKYNFSQLMKKNYEVLLEKQMELKKMIEIELQVKCGIDEEEK